MRTKLYKWTRRHPRHRGHRLTEWTLRWRGYRDYMFPVMRLVLEGDRWLLSAVGGAAVKTEIAGRRHAYRLTLGGHASVELQVELGADNVVRMQCLRGEDIAMPVTGTITIL